MEEPLVSVVVPFYKNIEWLKEAIDSIINQVYSNTEIIIINDGSTENTEEFLKKYNSQVKYFVTENNGAAKARNYGILKSTGKYVAFLDSDDIWTKEKLHVQINMLEKNPNKNWAISSYTIFDDNNHKKVFVQKVPECEFPNLLFSCPIATPTVVIRKDFLLQNSKIKFPENFKYGEDSCLWISISEYGSPCVIYESLVYVRNHGKNAARDISSVIIARSNIYHHIKDNKIYLRNKKKISSVCWIAYKYCAFINILFGKIGMKYKIIQKALFAPVWILFKQSYKKNN